MVEKLGEMMKGRLDRIEKGSSERIIEEKTRDKTTTDEKEGLKDTLF